MALEDRLEQVENEVEALVDDLADLRRRLVGLADGHGGPALVVVGPVELDGYEVLAGTADRYEAAITGHLPSGQQVRFEHHCARDQVEPIIRDVRAGNG